MKNIKTYNNGYDRNYSNMSKGFPEVNECLNLNACSFQNFTTVCTYPYKGFLCAGCLDGYFSDGFICFQCPSRREKIMHMSIAAFLVLLMIATVVALVWVKSKKQELDRFLSKTKITVNYYYNCSKIFQIMSFVQWPKEISEMIKYVKVLELNPMTLLSIKCWLTHFDLYDNYLLFISINGAIIVLAVSSIMLLNLSHSFGKINNKKYKHLRKSIISVTFLIVFLLYSPTSVSIVQLLPVACKTYYLAYPKKYPVSYFMQDLAMRCFTPYHEKMVIPVYISLLYVIGIPVFIPVLIWYIRHKISTKAKVSLIQTDSDERQAPHDIEDKLPSVLSVDYLPDVEDKVSENLSVSEDVYDSLYFFYGNYRENFFFWESTEMARKIFLASVAVFIGKESRTVLALLIMTSGISAVSHAHFQPFVNISEHCLQLTCLAAIFTILLAGLSMKIEASHVSSSYEQDVLGLTVALIFCTVVVAVILLGKYN